MLYLGNAIHVVPRTEAEQSFARHFATRGALLGVGLETLRIPVEGLKTACQIRGPELVDGRGCERIAAALESML